MDYSRLLNAVRALACDAGRAILEIYAREDFQITVKNDNSPLTLADQASHKIITEGLQKLDEWPILSEEAADIPYAERANWDTYWLVDPLDGTKEFIKRNGEFTVNIALIQQGRPVLSVVYVPVTGLLYSAAEGLGAFRQSSEQQAPEAIRVRPFPAGKQIIIAGSRSHAGQAQQDFVACLGELRCEVQSIGSSLKFCLVAEGKADLYPRFGPTSEWDTAAAQCIVEQAGGQVTGLDLKPLRYNTKDSLLNPHFLVFGECHAEWTNCLKQSETPC